MGANKLKSEIFEIAINDLLSEIDRIVEYGEVNSYIFEKAADIIRALLDERERLTKERDAAVEDLRGLCSACKHYTGFHNRGIYRSCWHDIRIGNEDRGDRWEWRGVKEDNDGKTDL